MQIKKILLISLFSLILVGTKEFNAGQPIETGIKTEALTTSSPEKILQEKIFAEKILADKAFFDQIYKAWKKTQKEPETWLEKNATTIILVSATAIFISYNCAKIYLAYKDGQEIYKLIKEFNQNPNYTYDKLATDARNLYYKQSLTPKSTSLSNDYPIAAYLEKRATEIKNLLRSSLFAIFCSKLKNLSENLKQELALFRNNIEFQNERREFNMQYRKQNYRNFRMLVVR